MDERLEAVVDQSIEPEYGTEYRQDGPRAADDGHVAPSRSAAQRGDGRRRRHYEGCVFEGRVSDRVHPSQVDRDLVAVAATAAREPDRSHRRARVVAAHEPRSTARDPRRRKRAHIDVPSRGDRGRRWASQARGCGFGGACGARRVARGAPGAAGPAGAVASAAQSAGCRAAWPAATVAGSATSPRRRRST